MTYSFDIRKQNYHTRILGWTYWNIFINSQFSLPLKVKSWKVLSENIHPTPKMLSLLPLKCSSLWFNCSIFYPLNKYSICWTYEWEKLGLLNFLLQTHLYLFSMFINRLDFALHAFLSALLPGKISLHIYLTCWFVCLVIYIFF